MTDVIHAFGEQHMGRNMINHSVIFERAMVKVLLTYQFTTVNDMTCNQTSFF